MVVRPSIIVLFGALASLGAAYRTQNFLVEAATPAIARDIGEAAERYRREKALQWLGQEMPPWPQPCPLRVTVSMNGSGGATSFGFEGGQILHQDMRIEGTLDRLLASVLPHEVTHTVLAHYFRCPVPRWADEGGSVLSEDELERRQHDQLVRQILNTPGRMIPLRRLFLLRQYPRDVMVLYAEGFSVSEFLVNRGNRQAFLAFVAHGMRGDWDAAVRSHYGFRNVEELEQAWFQSLRTPRRPPNTMMTASAGGRPGAPATPVTRVTRTTLPPAQPLASSAPVYRGMPAEEQPAPAAPPAGSWASPVAAPPSGSGRAGLVLPPPPVRLGVPRYDTPAFTEAGPPNATLGPPTPLPPPTGTPVGLAR
jgi:hypothetical protein